MHAGRDSLERIRSEKVSICRHVIIPDIQKDKDHLWMQIKDPEWVVFLWDFKDSVIEQLKKKDSIDAYLEIYPQNKDLGIIYKPEIIPVDWNSLNHYYKTKPNLSHEADLIIPDLNMRIKGAYGPFKDSNKTPPNSPSKDTTEEYMTVI